MADERDLDIDAEDIIPSSDQEGGGGELSGVDACAELINRAKRGVNTRPGPDEDAIRDVAKRVDVDAPDAVRPIRVQRDQR